MKKRILIVEDDASVRKALARVLEDEGYQISLAADDQEAFERFESGPMDLVLLDIDLPIRDGWDTFECITSRAPAFPIIITITGNANQHDRAVAAGIGALIEKPLDVPQFLKTIRELLVESAEARLRRLGGDNRDTRDFSPRPAVNQ